jgi:kynurenine formamidase
MMSNEETPVGLKDLLSQYKIIDLSVMVSDDYPCYWPTIMGYHASDWHNYDGWRGNFFTRYLIIEEHTGTHFDSPAHFIPRPETGLPHASAAGKITVEKVPVDQLIGSAVVVDCRSLRDQAEPGMSPIITKNFIQEWESNNGVLQAGDIVLLHTGWTTDFYRPFPEGLKFGWDVVIEKKAPGWPAPDGEAMSYLGSLGIRAVGVDSGSMGPLQNDAEPHWAGLGQGMVFIERLVNLEILPTRGTFFLFLPIKIEGGSGAPGRAIAFIPK